MSFLTRQKLADMIDDETILGKKVEFVYDTGMNRPHPVYMEFIEFFCMGHQEYVKYLLTNENTEKFKTAKEFQFHKQNFVSNVLDGQEQLQHIRIVDTTAAWEL